MCLECPTLVSGSGGYWRFGAVPRAVRIGASVPYLAQSRTSRSPCRVEFNTRSTTLVTHDAGGRYKHSILIYVEF